MATEKTLKFRKTLADLILKGEKTSTWRLFDDKDLKKGDLITFLVWETLQPFAKVKLTAVLEKTLESLEENDMDGHEKDATVEDMYKRYTFYYKQPVGPKTLVKICKFELIEKFKID